MNNKHNSILFSYIIGWFGMIFGSLTLNDLAIIIGMISTIIGLSITCFYRHLEYRFKKKQIKNQYNGQKSKE